MNIQNMNAQSRTVDSAGGASAGMTPRASAVLELKGSMNIWRHRRCELVPEGGGLRLRLYERDAPASGRPGAAPEHAPQASARLLAEYVVHEAVSIPERDNKRSHRFDVRATAATAGRAPQPGRERRLCFAAP